MSSSNLARFAIVDDDMPAWISNTTEDQIRLIREARTARGEDAAWIKDVEDVLHAKRLEVEAAQQAKQSERPAS